MSRSKPIPDTAAQAFFRGTLVVLLSLSPAAFAAQGETHTVTFRRLNGTVLSRETVVHGGSVAAPAAPAEADFTFKGWDHADRLGCVTNDIQVWALYEGTKTWPAGTGYGSESIAARDVPYSLEEYFRMYDNVAWTDEFSRSGTNVVNTDYWRYDTEDRNQLSYETSGGNQKEIDGYLTITVRREKATRSSWWGPDKEYDFTGGGLKSNGKVAFKYGRCEIRAKLTHQRGAWPAFWMMGNTGGWPNCGELDVLEQPSGGDWVAGTFHIPGRGNARSIQNGRTTTPEDGVHFADGFHRFGTIINEREILWYVDDHIYKRMDVRDSRYDMIRDRPYFIIFGMGLQSNIWITAKGEAPVDKYDVPELDERGVDFLVDYCRIYTNTNAGNTVAYEAAPPAANLSAPVNAAVWRGWDMTWNRLGSSAYESNINKGYTERYYIKTALAQYLAREKTDILTFLTDPNVVTSENRGQFDIPGYTMVFMSANANDWNADDNAGSSNYGRLQLFASALFNHGRFAVSESCIDILTLSSDANFTNCVAVCADLKEKATGARVKVVGVNVISTNGIEIVGGSVAQGFDTLFAKIMAMKDDNVILFLQGMDLAKWRYVKGRADETLSASYSLLGSYTSVWPVYQSAYATKGYVSASATHPANVKVPKNPPVLTYEHNPQALQATVAFDETPEVDDGYADSFAAEDYAKKVTIAFPGYSGEALADFPVLVRLSPAIDGFSYADFVRPDGGDLRFADAAGNLIPHEIDTWDTNGVSTVWVKVPSLTSATTITAHYGCTRLARVDPSQTWDGDYVGVWHLGERSLPLRESSGTAADFTLATGDSVVYAAGGIVGGAVDFTAAGSTNSVVAVDHDGLEGFEKGTLEVWTKQAAHVQNAGILSKRANYNSQISYFIYDNGSSTVLCLPKNGGATNYQTCVSTSPAMGAWNHQAFTFDATAASANTKSYLDGILKSTATKEFAVYSGLANLCLGAMQAGAKDNFVGQVDEVRISRSVRSADWIKATHDTVANASFAAYTVDDGGPGGPDRILRVNVDAGMTNSLDASLVTAAITNIVKTGAGTLVAMPVSGYTGDFDIREGVWRLMAAGDFGATSAATGSGVIHVRDGASIEYAGSDTKPACLAGKTVHLYGAAASGARGKIWLSASVQMGSPGLGNAVTVILHDDATFYSGNRLRMNGTLDLGGHTLTLRNASFDIGGVITNGGAIVVASATTWLTETTTLDFAADCADVAYVEVLAGGTLNLKGGSRSAYAHGWKILDKGGTLTANWSRKATETGVSLWDGAIEFSGASKIASYAASKGGWSISNTVFNAAGPISGSGTLAGGPGWLNLHHADNTYTGAVTYAGKSVTQGDPCSVPPGGGGIGVWNGAAVFPNASSITLRDSARLEFMDNIATTVGPLAFVGDTAAYAGDPGDDTQSVKGGSSTSRSTIAGFTKTGSHVLVFDSPVHVTGTATVSEGTLKIPYRSTKGTPGLYETRVTPKVATGSDWTDRGYIFNRSTTEANYRMCQPWDDTYLAHVNLEEYGICSAGARRASKGFINNGSSGWDDGFFASNADTRLGWWYRGYIWNDATVPVTYTVWTGTQYGGGVWLGEDHSTFLKFKYGSSYTAHGKEPPDAQEMTVQPGATRIDIFIPSLQAALWCFAVPSAGDRHGLVFAPSSVCSAATLNEQIRSFYDAPSAANTNAVGSTLRQFREFVNVDGADSLFTADVFGENTEEAVALQPVFDTLVFAAGTTLDLDGNVAFRVKDLVGSPTVVNSPLFGITNNWTICAADFPSNDPSARRPMTVAGRLAFAQGSTFALDDASAFAREGSGIVVATAMDGISGVPVPVAGLDGWRLSVRGNRLLLLPASGLTMTIR